MSTTSSTPPPSYISQEKQENEQRPSREGEQVAQVSGVSPSRSSKHGGDDDHHDRKSSRSPHRSRSHRHRHRHEENAEAGPSTSRNPGGGSDEVVDDDKKSTKSRHSHRSKTEEHGHTEAQSVRDDVEGETKSTKSHRSHRSRREEHGHRHGSHSRESGGHDDEGTSREKGRSHRPESNASSPTDNDDNKSTKTSPEQSNETRHTEKHHLSQEDIERLRRNYIRRSQYGPDLLKELARNGVPQDFDAEGLPNFRVVAGKEARTIFNDILREEERLAHGQKRSLSIGKERPIVFAFPHHPPNPALRAGRGVVDFYLHHLKGKTGTNRLKGGRRKMSFLDGELDENFMKIKQSIDNLAQKRLSAALSQEGAEEHLRPPITTSQSAPAAVPTTDPKDESLGPPKRPRISSRDSNPSVLSLPYLGATNMDLRTPLPLRVTNPDPASSSGSDSKRSSLVDASKPSEKRVGRSLSVVEEGEEPRGEKRHSHRHHRKHEQSASPDSVSTSPSSSSSKRGRKRSNEEILIVLMDSDNEKTEKGRDKKWNDKLKRSNSAKAPKRMASVRNSPWNGPVATSHGEVHRYVPTVPNFYASPTTYGDESEESSSDEDSNDMSPISMKTALKALGYYNSNSTPHLPTPQSQLPTPALPQPMLPSISSPYRPVTTQIYESPQHIYSNSTPNLPLPQVSGVASSYVTPWVSSSSAAPTPLVPPPGTLPPMDHPAASLYSSPYIKPAQAPYPYPNGGSVVADTPNSKRELPLQIYASPAAGSGLGLATPRSKVGVSPYASGTSGGHVPLPALSIYSPYARAGEF